MEKGSSERQSYKCLLLLLTESQMKFLVSFSSGLSHVLIGTVVLGYFFPGITGEVSAAGFILGLIFAIFFFILGLLLSRKIKV